MAFISKVFRTFDELISEKIIPLERQNSGSWWKGILVGFGLAILSLGTMALVSGSGLAVEVVRYLFVLVLGVSWGVLMLAIFLDGKYVAEHSDWQPALGLYLGVVLFFPVVGFFFALVYLYKRHSSLGVP
jgi:heme/copper-type cytochrome/quinol oxidase subunit 4